MLKKPVFFIVVAVAGICLLVLYKGHYVQLPSDFPLAGVFNSSEIQFEIVDTPEAREQGLSGRTSLEDNYGMLFVFQTRDRYGFWMKDMLIPIDIIWLSDSGTILGIEDSVEPSTYPNVFYAPEPVDRVLEMKAGSARMRHWNIGTTIAIP